MRNIWIPLGAVLTLLAVAVAAGAEATKDAKATPVPSATAAQGKAATTKPPPPAKKKKLVNLNAASREELKKLPGGSDEEAARIIAGRPYNSKAVLLTNKVVSEGRYSAIKSFVLAGEPSTPAAPKK